jgi:hypothetical protein
MDPAAAKQQIAERVKQASRFLVTVNANPTVDQLAACIGLTLLLNKMNKHATAVFSGKVPSTIEFLQPEKTIEPNPDSLRDFIISLDKNKADKLRYKVEDDVVRIYITPYRTSLSEKDFVFSEGDFNVEVVIALGVAQRSSLDAAITAHGRILHDATVISVNAGAGRAPDLGQVNWQDPQASSLSEMLVSISESFGPGLIDGQIATAFLTGIVAETNRFANKKTSPKVMTMSAQLMAAGANQQLIVQKLEPPAPPPPPPPPPPPKPLPPAPREPKKPKTPPPPLKPEGIMDVPKDDKTGGKTDIELGTTEIHIDEQGNIRTQDELRSKSAEPTVPTEPLITPVALPVKEEVSEEPHLQPAKPSEPASPLAPLSPPLPAEPAASPHAFMGATAQPGQSDTDIPFSATSGQPDWAAPYEMVPLDPMAGADNGAAASAPWTSTQGHSVQPPSSSVTPVNMPVDSARSAVESALSKAPFDPAFNPPVQSLHTQSFNNNEPLHGTEARDAVPSNLPPLPSSDTPMLVLPTGGNGPVGATPPPQPPPMPAAPPPMPPPLVAGPGAIVPTPPKQ